MIAKFTTQSATSTHNRSFQIHHRFPGPCVNESTNR